MTLQKRHRLDVQQNFMTAALFILPKKVILYLVSWTFLQTL